MSELIQSSIIAHQEAITTFFDAESGRISMLAKTLAQTFEQNGKLLVCGNGGSACDALHIAGEFVGRFRDDRRALPAMALSADPGILTAVGNDYGFEQIFSRQVEAHGKEGDVLVALSTSGSSANVLRALDVARERGLYTILLTGEKGRESNVADSVFAVSGGNTARIQEVHITLLHILAELVEKELGL